MRFPCLRPAAVTVLVCALLASVAQGQLGKLTKKASDAAASKAGVQTSGSARYVKKIDMTSAQIVAVNKGLETAVKMGPETIKKWEKAQEAYDKAYADYTKKKEKYDACIESEKQKAESKLEAANKKSGAATEKVQKETDTTTIVAQAEKAQAAAERVSNGTATAADRQTLADFQKTMAGVQGNSNAAMAAMQQETALHKEVADSIKKKCGEEPQPPSLGGSAGSRAGKAGGAAPTSASEEINQASAEAAGMSESEYRLAREKAKGFALSNTEVQGGSDTPDDEAKAINQALAQTRALIDEANKANVPLM